MYKVWTACDVIKNDVFFQKYGGHDVTMMTSSTRDQFFWKIVVNINMHAKLSVPMIFGLEVRLGAFLALPRIKCVGQLSC